MDCVGSLWEGASFAFVILFQGLREVGGCYFVDRVGAECVLVLLEPVEQFFLVVIFMVLWVGQGLQEGLFHLDVVRAPSFDPGSFWKRALANMCWR